MLLKLEIGLRLLPIFEEMAHQMSQALDEFDIAEGRMVIGECRVVSEKPHEPLQLPPPQEERQKIITV